MWPCQAEPLHSPVGNSDTCARGCWLLHTQKLLLGCMSTSTPPWTSAGAATCKETKGSWKKAIVCAHHGKKSWVTLQNTVRFHIFWFFSETRKARISRTAGNNLQERGLWAQQNVEADNPETLPPKCLETAATELPTAQICHSTVTLCVTIEV